MDYNYNIETILLCWFSEGECIMNIRKFCRLLIVLAVATAMIGSSALVASAATKTPYKVTGLKATGATDTTISISWKKSTNAKSYEVQYKLSTAKTWKSLKTTSKKATFKGLKSSKKYQFKVRGLNGKKKGKFSTTLSQQTYVRPAKVNSMAIYATERNKKAISLKWANTKAKNVSYYQVTTRKVTSSSVDQQDTQTPDFTTRITMRPNTWYEFKVRAVNTKTGKFPALKSAWSAPVCFCTTKGSRVITGEKEDAWVKYTMHDTFVVGEDEALITDRLYTIPDPTEDWYATDDLWIDAITFPADLEGAWTDGTTLDLKGKTFSVGDTVKMMEMNGEKEYTIQGINVCPHNEYEYLTGDYAVTFVLSDAYRPTFVW